MTRPHGIRGELRVKLHNPDSRVLFAVSHVTVRLPSAEDRQATIRSARPAAAGIALLALDDVHDRNGAECLRGAALLVPRDRFAPADEDEFYVHDVLGAQVVGQDGTVYGRVVDYVSFPAADVLVVQGDKRYEIPMIDDFVRRVDPEQRQVVVASIDDFETA